MKFEVATSKLYQQIMEAAAGFFGLDSANATETDIHAAFDGQTPLADQLKVAQSAAVADLQTQLNDLKADATKTTETLAGLQSQFDTLKIESDAKDSRITELQTQIATAQLATDAMKNQHQKETAALAGELAKTKAGKTMETDAGGDTHDAAKRDLGGNETNVIVAKSSALIGLTQKKTA